MSGNINVGFLLIWEETSFVQAQEMVGHGALGGFPGRTSPFVRAEPCPKNIDIMNPDSTEQASPHNIYVDDDLMGDVRCCLPYTLVAAIERIFF